MIVQLAGRLQAGTERLLYDDPPETIWRLGLVQTALQQTLRDDLVHHRRGSQVIDDLIRQVMFLLQELDALTQFVVFIGVRGIEGEVIDILQEVIDQARKMEKNIKVASLPAAAMPRTRTIEQTDGLLKAVVDADTGKILGCTLFCAESSEVINTVSLAMRLGQDYTFLRDSIFTHPSMSEALNDLFGLIK